MLKELITAKKIAAALAMIIAVPTQAQDSVAQWDKESVGELLAAIEGARAEGLDPRDYDPEPLRQALAAGQTGRLHQLASDRFRHLARDYTQGHVGPEDRIGWHIVGTGLSAVDADALMARALAEGRIGPLLAQLLPADPRYLQLRAALSKTREPAKVQTIRVNMERWRWLPRALGATRLETNVPSYMLTYSTEGRTVARHRVIVGKPGTPTPQFSATVTGVILNPWWNVPNSIVRESVGGLIRTRPQVARARGYEWSGASVRQRPGPGNSLGQMKLVMPNPFSVYVHDTPSKALFARSARALSHGCVRTEQPLELASALLAGEPGGTPAEIDATVAAGQTRKLELARPIPVYMLYFTAEADATGTLVTYPDIYERDAVVAAELVYRGALDGVG